MISKALRGHDAAGLLRYLFGAGRANEHTNQRVVASSDPTWTGTLQPDRATLRQLTEELRDSVRRHGDGTKDGYVYHVAISLAADDRPLTDAKWQRVAQRFADKLGLDDQVSWMAVNHGPSAHGNDHIHLVVNLIRDDTGRAQPMPYDRLRRREACIELEEEFGLAPTAPAGQGLTSTLSRREVEAFRDGHVASVPDLSQHRIATIVRAVATGARSEQEFVERLRGEGLVVRARHAPANRDTVTGYSVAMENQSPGRSREPLVWYGGGRLAKDLRLPALRAKWGQTAEQRDASAAAWLSATERRRKAEPANLAAASDALRRAHRRLQTVPPRDISWHATASEVAGLIAAAASTTTDDRARRQLITAWQAITRATPAATYIGIDVAPGDAAQLRGSDADGATSSGYPVGDRDFARPPVLWPAPPMPIPPTRSETVVKMSTLLKGASRVIMAAQHADASQRPAVTALLQQAIELAAHIAHAASAQHEASAAQRRAVLATERAMNALANASRPAGWQFTRSGSETLQAAREAHELSSSIGTDNGLIRIEGVAAV